MLKTTHPAQVLVPVKAPDWLEHSAAEQGNDLIRAATCLHRALMRIHVEAGSRYPQNPSAGDRIHWR